MGLSQILLICDSPFSLFKKLYFMQMQNSQKQNFAIISKAPLLRGAVILIAKWLRGGDELFLISARSSTLPPFRHSDKSLCHLPSREGLAISHKFTILYFMLLLYRQSFFYVISYSQFRFVFFSFE